MHKKELIDAVAEAIELSRLAAEEAVRVDGKERETRLKLFGQQQRLPTPIVTAEKAVAAIFGCITTALYGGDCVKLAGFGTFKTVQRKPTVANNMWTGEKILVPTKRAVKFIPSPELKEAVNTNRKI